MKTSAVSGPSGNHILLCPIWFFRMPASTKLKEMRLTLYPFMPFNSYILDKTEICKLIHVHSYIISLMICCIYLFVINVCNI